MIDELQFEKLDTIAAVIRQRGTIDKYIGVRPTFAAGDTDTDIEMLQSAEHVLLMDRGNDEAQAEAKAGGWWVQPPGW